MKKFFFSLIAILVSTGIAFSEESVLLDFSELVDDYQGEHQATVIDFSMFAGTQFTEDERQKMITSLLIPNWEVEFSSSSQTVINSSLSYTKPATVANTSSQFAGEQVMGVRVHFPELPHNSYAWIKPPFAIPAFSTNTIVDGAPRGTQFNQMGTVKNVGVLRSVEINVYGMNYPIGLSVVLRDQDEQYYEVKLGYLDFDGWRKLVWQNPNYVEDVRNRVLVRKSLYPREIPYVVLDSIQYYKDAMNEGGDFITYVKDIAITYDLAMVTDVDEDLKHEEIWGILADREEERRRFETSRLSDKEVLRFLEQKKMHKDTEEPEDTVQ